MAFPRDIQALAGACHSYIENAHLLLGLKAPDHVGDGFPNGIDYFFGAAAKVVVEHQNCVVLTVSEGNAGSVQFAQNMVGDSLGCVSVASEGNRFRRGNVDAAKAYLQFGGHRENLLVF
jgi:hypothetical protein